MDANQKLPESMTREYQRFHESVKRARRNMRRIRKLRKLAELAHEGEELCGATHLAIVLGLVDDDDTCAMAEGHALEVHMSKNGNAWLGDLRYDRLGDLT